jgi:histidine ammonia-lyase
MQNPEVSLLPQGLMRPGMPAQWFGFGFTQVHFGEAARHAAARTFIPASETPNTQDDTALPTFFAYEKHVAASWCLDAATAMLATVASQALWAAERKAPPALADFLETVRAHFPPIDGTRRRKPGEEVERLAKAFSEAALTGGFGPPSSQNGSRPAKRATGVRRQAVGARRR